MAVERQTANDLSKIEIRHLNRYKFSLKYVNEKNVLDIACGVGYGSNLISKHAKSVLGCDYSKDAIEYANTYWKEDNIMYNVFDITSHEKIGSFDVLISFETIEHIKQNISKTIEFYKKNLKSGGILIMSHPENETDKGLNPFHFHFNIKKKNMLYLVESMGFELIEYLEQEGYGKEYYNYSIYALRLK